MTSPEEFAGTASLELAMGVVRGSRSFKVDYMGRLTGVAYPGVWAPGENLAQCLKVDWVMTYAPPVDTRSWLEKLIGVPAPRRTDCTFSYGPPEPDPTHSMSDCRCGFYGYYEGSNDFYEPGMVSGVVEGYGETLIGTRGFRCSKARIVALHIPVQVPVPQADLIRRNYQNVPFFPTFESMISEFPPDGGTDRSVS